MLSALSQILIKGWSESNQENKNIISNKFLQQLMSIIFQIMFIKIKPTNLNNKNNFQETMLFKLKINLIIAQILQSLKKGIYQIHLKITIKH